MQMKETLRYVVLAGIFLVPFIVLLVTDSFFFPYITGKNFVFRILVEIMFVGWLILSLYEPKYRPRFSWIVIMFATLLGVMFFADLLGEYPLKSFWSNFERMSGYVTLVHLGAYMLVVGSVMQSKEMWNRLFVTTLVVAVVASVYALAHVDASQGTSWRVVGTLGNSTYMAVYMLFHIFIAALMVMRTASRQFRYGYAALIPLFAFMLIQTGTRGAVLGLVVGVILSALYVALFAKENPILRKISIGGLFTIVVLVGLFVTFRDSAFIQNDPRLQRISEISLEAGSTRLTIWSIALEGVKERPLLGWGQGNFNYVFNTYYKPSLYGQEQWFDRVHNLVFDWLIAGGILGALSFLGLFGAVFYYILVRPFVLSDFTFTVPERGLLLGLLAGYVVHNLFVFDNIVSYIFLIMILSYIHSRVGTPVRKIENVQVSTKILDQVVLPAGAVFLVAIIYVVNVPGILAARDIINALGEQTVDGRYETFQTAWNRGSFASQEIYEQVVLQSARDLISAEVPTNEKNKIYQTALDIAQQELVEKAGDARIHLFGAMLYQASGNTTEQLIQLNAARLLSPNKQTIIFQQGLAYLVKGESDTALKYFKEAYELAPENKEARNLYAAGALYAGDDTLFYSLIDTESRFEEFARLDLSVRATHEKKKYALLEKILKFRIQENPKDPQLRTSLASSYVEVGDIARAIEVLSQAIVDMPEYKEQLQIFIEQLSSN